MSKCHCLSFMLFLLIHKHFKKPIKMLLYINNI
nr:MAG TPA: hypothetical protein [Caudoviricetes sp.]